MRCASGFPPFSFFPRPRSGPRLAGSASSRIRAGSGLSNFAEVESPYHVNQDLHDSPVNQNPDLGEEQMSKYQTSKGSLLGRMGRFQRKIVNDPLAASRAHLGLLVLRKKARTYVLHLSSSLACLLVSVRLRTSLLNFRGS